MLRIAAVTSGFVLLIAEANLFAYASMLALAPDDRSSCIEQTVANRVPSCAHRAHPARRTGATSSLANRPASRTPAMAIPPHTHPSGGRMVAKSRFLAWFLGSYLQRFCRLAGAEQIGSHCPAAVLVGSAIFGIWIGRTGSGSDGRGAFPFPHFLDDRAGWSDRLASRLGFLSCPSVSLGLPSTDDSPPSHRFKPNHVPAAAAGLESSQHRIAMVKRASPARGQHNLPCGHALRGR